tara:strand:+ start:43288 stop:44016 length:729 start_codon:yes stop_codon:yes gene_type:complete
LIIVGNDVVDLGVSLPTLKSQDARFLKRVFTPAEQILISTSPNPELQLWLFWAAKETAYKIISKIKTPPVFSHKLFQITIQSHSEQSVSKQNLQITYDEYVIPAFGIWDAQKLHVVGNLDVTEPKKSVLDTDLTAQTTVQIYSLTRDDIIYWERQNNLNSHFSKAEQESINHSASAIAKFKLKQSLAQNFNWNIQQLEVIRPSLNKKMHPPFLLYHGQKTNIDISLSHHGEWVAWVYNSAQT